MKRKNRTINGGLVNKEPCGYCHSRLHEGYVTVEIMKKHKCREKQCSCFECFVNHPYFAEEQVSREQSKMFQYIKRLFCTNRISTSIRDELFARLKCLKREDLHDFIVFLHKEYGYQPKTEIGKGVFYESETVSISRSINIG